MLGDAFAGAPPAGPARRLAAFAVDSAVVVAAAAVAFAVTRSTLIAALVLAELVVGVTVWEARTGRTFGNLLLGLRSARVEAPFALGSPRAGSRALVVLAGAAVAGVGQWFVVGSSAFDRTPLRQGWHDKVGRSVVVDVRAERASSGAPAGAVAPVLTSAAPPALTRAHASVPAPTPPPAAATTRVAAPSVPVPPAPARSVAVPPVAAPPIAVPPVAAPAIPASAVPAPAGPQAAPSPRPATAFVLTLDDGRWTEVRGPGVVGRSPQVAADERYDHVVTIDDTTRSVSRTHARFGVSPAGFWVQDAGSGNGTIVVLPDGRAVLAPQGARTPVPVGATVRLGERTFTVTEVPHVQ
ncbi:hypothetical protein Cch01nite_12830 [Cellulomonas chitinilytica]|uniref:FHA domain-containing protein n=1 Tax=Cellulomonas chitinilytica TaxID=398759 RepID=A0A919U1X1_9CELL|nr:hypothetical protein Cch01nite_12830 [Cellulomonas chitinilytica]